MIEHHLDLQSPPPFQEITRLLRNKDREIFSQSCVLTHYFIAGGFSKELIGLLLRCPRLHAEQELSSRSRLEALRAASVWGTQGLAESAE